MVHHTPLPPLGKLPMLSLPLSRNDLIKLQNEFILFIKEVDKFLAEKYEQNLNQENDALYINLVPHLEDFIGHIFNITSNIHLLQHHHHCLAPIFNCRRNFIQRRAVKKHTHQDFNNWDSDQNRQVLLRQLNIPTLDELSFAIAIQGWLEKEQEHRDIISIAEQYCAWACLTQNGQAHHKDTVLFHLPQTIDYANLVDLHPQTHAREGFKLTDMGLTRGQALGEATYCIHCHNQNKDSCSKGFHNKTTPDLVTNPLGNTLTGCPLGQKISQMAQVKSQGFTLGALAIAMVDNPMIPATGHRICNACSKACIYQKQTPVNIPSLETQILNDVLNLPYGFEIYHLLTQWNPLNFKRPVPKPPSGYTVLIAGLGPAGFTLAHHLLQEGHKVIGIDGLKIEPIEKHLLNTPIVNVNDLHEDLDTRPITGFGGVMEYGITARWNKNYLKLIYLTLARHPHCLIQGGINFGGAITAQQAFELGVDHIALCLGAGSPKFIPINNVLSKSVRTASDFLMALQLTGAAQESSIANLQLRLPVVVIGGGLTAVDTATEALAYYPVQVEKFLATYETLCDQYGINYVESQWSKEECVVAQEFLNHARHLRAHPKDRLKLLQSWGGVTLAYRNKIQDSPAYRLNHEELSKALAEGITFLENATPTSIERDPSGQCTGLALRDRILPAHSILIAVGTNQNTANVKTKTISHFGDLDPTYSGSVVHAMASAKNGYPEISRSLSLKPPRTTNDVLSTFRDLLQTRVHSVSRLTPSIIELVVRAPLAARNYQPGQFFRLQNFQAFAARNLIFEGLALTGSHVQDDLITLVVLELGASSSLVSLLKPNDPVVLMGPTGEPTQIPSDERVLLVGGGLGNAVLISIAEAMKAQNCHVTYIAGYKRSEDRFYMERIEACANEVIWCCEKTPGFASTRPQDQIIAGNVIDALKDIDPLKYDRLLTIGSDRMMAAVQNMGRTHLKSIPIQLASINSPMQCMMKGLCGQCIQSHIKDGKEDFVFSCACQDQNLKTAQFDVLHQRLTQNATSEKLTLLKVNISLRN